MEPPYSSNIEGLYFAAGACYVVSDNMQAGKPQCGDIPEFKTSFIVIED